MNTSLFKCRWSRNRMSLGAARTFARQAIVTLYFVVTGLVVYAQDGTQFGKGVPSPELPEVNSPFTLLAVNDPDTGKSSFSYAGEEVEEREADPRLSELTG